MRFRARVHPLYAGHRQPEKDFWGYTQAISVNQASMFLGRRYPYPSYTFDEPVVDLDKPKALKGEIHDSATYEWWKDKKKV